MELNKIYNENCLNTMAKMPDNFVDLVVTSPPYDNLRKYNGFSFEFEKVAKELYRVVKNGGIIVWIVGDATIKGNETGTSFKQALYFKEIEFNLYDTMIYEKINNSPLNHPRYEQKFEYMFIFSKGKPNTINFIKEKCKYAGKIQTGTIRNNGGDLLSLKHGAGNPIHEEKIKGNIWGYTVGGKKDIKSSHPAMFPEELAKDHIISWSKENDIVYDPFMGSGTTGKMAKLLNRNFIGSEISQEYCKIAEERILKC